MGDRRSSIGVAQFIWVAVAGLSAVFFVAAVVKLGAWLAIRTDHDVAVTLALPMSVLIGMVLWIQLLGIAWRWRRSYLRRAGTKIAASVVDSSYRRLNRASVFGQHRIRIEVQFAHPETGSDHRLRRDYKFSDFQRRRATAFQSRFSQGAPISILVHGRHAGFDLYERPTWTDIW
ncbi:hypothetical protein ACFWVM_24800 [Nocardia fluminea]|uniref:hypothetical protein n=1 Tax=Nocardia fluminea TaxID=134984 RepID=UPI003663A5EB